MNVPRATLAGLAVVLVCLFASPAAAKPSSSQITSKAHAIMEVVYGPCFATIYTGNLKKASVVKTSTYTKGVVTVAVFLTQISTGRDTTYEFRVNTGLTKYPGPPGPGTGIPVNAAARALVLACPD